MLHNTIQWVCLSIAALILAGLLGGCATATSSLECGVESLNPTVMAAVDSFESAAIAIKLSNRVLLEMPISEQERWPTELYGAPSGGALLKMGLSLLGSSQGVTIPLEIDRQTGLPRPTSALYIFLKEREQMLTREANKEDLRFFRSQPPGVIAREIPQYRRTSGEALIDEHVYRNPLMAFGVVTANRQEMVRVQQDVDLMAQGFRQCDAWVHKSAAGEIKPAACQDPTLKPDNLEARMKKAVYTPADADGAPQKRTPPLPEQRPLTQTYDLEQTGGASKANAAAVRPETGNGKTTKSRTTRNSKSKRAKETAPAEPPQQLIASGNAKQNQAVADFEPVPSRGIIYVDERQRQIGEKTEELETMRKNYGKLAGRVYNAAVAGADFTTAAIVKIGCAIVNGTRAFDNIQKEFKGARGVYNLAMVISRVKLIIDSLGYYKDNLGLQFTAYRTMYQQIKGTYPALQDESPENERKTREALLRIEQARAVLNDLEPKLMLFAQGHPVEFTADEADRLNTIARRYPAAQDLADALLAAWQPTAE